MIVIMTHLTQILAVNLNYYREIANMNTTKKKYIIIGVFAIIVLAIALFVIFASKEEEESLIEKPIPQISLPITKETIKVEIKEISSKRKNYPLYTITNDIKLQKIQDLLLSVGFRDASQNSSEGYYLWKRENDLVTYSIVSNILTISGENVLRIGNDVVGAEIFSRLVEEYFGEEWEYGLFQEKKYENGIVEYNAFRKLEDDLYVQMREWINGTDSIQVQDGKVISARLLLSSFSPTGEYAPLVVKNQLEKYIAQQDYPKEIVPEPSLLLSELNIDAYSSVYREATDNLTDCISDEVDVVYYYKHTKQGLLTPVYKISARCDANYENKKYQIPVTIFTNAIDPSYILTD